MDIQKNVSLVEYTSFGVGGRAENFALVENSLELERALSSYTGNAPITFLGYGTNTLISDKGIEGLVIVIRGGDVKRDGNVLMADAGVEWDSLVKTSIESNLWGMELLSGIPGSVGAAIFINISAYGQSASDTVLWVDVFDRREKIVRRMIREHLQWGYKQSVFQAKEKGNVILRAAFELSREETTPLEYQGALDVAAELSLDTNSLGSRREIILEARNRAGSIFEYGKGMSRTAGSFFRNPLVTAEQAEKIIQADESGKSTEAIRKMNAVHGGSDLRVSAAHVMLAAGFSRGQCFGPVCLNEKNLLKIENKGEATAQQIYDTAKQIVATCQEKLGVTLEPEASLLGKFD